MGSGARAGPQSDTASRRAGSPGVAQSGSEMSSKMSKESNFSGPVMSVTVSLQADQLSSLDGWRSQQPTKPSRAAGLIILAAKALTTEAAH